MHFHRVLATKECRYNYSFILFFMKKLFISLLIFVFFLSSTQVFALFDPTYYSTLSNEDKQTISLIQNVNPRVVSIIGKTKTEQQTIQCFIIFNGICVQSGDEQPEHTTQWESVVIKWSGFFIHSSGLIITNKHVVNQPDLSYDVLTIDGKIYPAKIIKISSTDDIAILKIEGENFQALKFGNSDVLMIWQTALAIGNTLGEYQNTVTKGIISGLNRTLTAEDENSSETLSGVIQTSASISQWNSGWPLIDSVGNVIWMSTAIDLGGQNIGFAIPSNRIRDFLKEYVHEQKNSKTQK